MQRNFIVSVVQVVTLVLILCTMWFRSFQSNHLEGLILTQQRELSAVSETVRELRQQLTSGAFASASGPARSSSGDAGDFQARFFQATEWEALVAPGNYLKPRTDRLSVDGAVDGGTMNRAFITDIPGLNPVTQNASDVSELYHYVTETLASRQRNDPERWIPNLAYRIEVNENFTEYHVYLKRGVRWHQPAVDLNDARYAWLQGDREMVADDFVFYLELIKNTQVDAAFARNYYETCTGIEVINDHEFIVRWSEPQFTSISATLGLAPLPRWLYGHDEDGVAFDESEVGRQFNNHWYNTKAIGVGPYRFVSWTQGGSIVLERNERYHAEQPPLRRIEFRVIEDATARLNELRAGSLSYIPMMQTQYNNEVTLGGTPGFTNGDLENQTYQGPSYRYLGWNADGRYFGDRRVRQAMTYALNRELLLAENFFGLGSLITGHLYLEGPDYNHDIVPYPFDLRRAAELLTEAGWVDNNGDGIREKNIDGNVVNFEFGMMTYGYRPEFVAAMEAYRNDLRRIGVIMNVVPVEWAVMVQRMTEKDFDAFTGGWVLGWEADLYQIWHSSQADAPGGSNRVGFRNAEVDQIIAQTRASFDPAERTRLFRRFHEIVHEEQPYTFWFAPLEIGAWRNNVENVNFSPIRPFDSNLNWYIESP